MDDCMDKLTAINLLDNLIGMVDDNQENDYDTALKMGIEALKANVQPVVRCKDCMNWIPGNITDTDEFIPPKCDKYQQMVGHSSDDFCSLGERKDGEQNETD